MVSFQSTETKRLYGFIREKAVALGRDDAQTRASLGVRELVLNIAKGCNLGCPYCFANAGRYQSNDSSWMSKEDAYSYTITMLRAHRSVRRVKLFGGEPFMNIPAMEGVVEALADYRDKLGTQENQISIGCVSNLTIFSERIVELARRCNLRVTASIDGPRDIHDRNRRFTNGRGSYDRIVRTIHRYRETGVQIAGVESVYTPAHMNAGITMLDLHNFLVQEFGAPRVIITPLQAQSGCEAELLRFRDWVRTCAKEYLSESVRCRKSVPDLKHVLDETMGLLLSPTVSTRWCGLGVTTLTVDVDGKILPCYTLLHDPDSWQMGAVSTRGIVSGDRKNAVELKLADASPRQCKECDIRDSCRGCPGGIFASSERFTAVDPVGCSFRIGMIEGLLNEWGKE